MNFKVKIHNIGKLRKAEIALRPLTILAGPNSTGKSFVSKTLYSVFSSADDPLLAYIQEELKPLKRSLRLLQRNFKWYNKIYSDISTHRKAESKAKDETKILNDKLEKVVLNIHKLERTVSHFNLLESTEDFDQKVIQQLNTLIKSSNGILPLSTDKAVQERQLSLFGTTKSRAELERNFRNSIERLENLKKSLNLTEMTVKGFMTILEKNLKGNFQISALQELMGEPDQSADITLQDIDLQKTEKAKLKDSICKMVIKENKIQFDPSLLRLALLQNSFRPIYLESPIYWKLRNALTMAGRTPLYTERQSLLVPKYFKDLNFMLMDELSGEVAFPEILKALNQNTIKGNLIIDESGSLKFKEKSGRAYSLPSTATGIVQLGILALLIEKKVLDKRTVLFVDEPEVNLHPSWQVEMMKVLVALVKAGAFVVMATHSADILKWLEVYLKNHPDEENMVALNQMALQEDGLSSSVEPEGNVQNQIRVIKKNLTKPYLKLFLEGKD